MSIRYILINIKYSTGSSSYFIVQYNNETRSAKSISYGIFDENNQRINAWSKNYYPCAGAKKTTILSTYNTVLDSLSINNYICQCALSNLYPFDVIINMAFNYCEEKFADTAEPIEYSVKEIQKKKVFELML